MIFWSQFDEGRADYDGEHAAEDIIKFIKANQLPLVTEFNDEVRSVYKLYILYSIKPQRRNSDCQECQKFPNSFCKILKNKWYHAKVLPKRFYLNGHTIGFC